ncbi:MAG: L,D-transpeptidase [Chthoniobacterales bacterium]
MRFFTYLLVCFTVLPAITGCAFFEDHKHHIVIDVRHQELTVYADETPVKTFPISTSKFGIGDSPGSCATPGGILKVIEKIGSGCPPGTVFKSRHATGEILPTNAPGRDPIVTRILWLKGTEPQNSNAYNRFIYIHGTPEEKKIGRPSSFGCIRMRSQDVIELYNIVGVGATVEVKTAGAPRPLAHIVRGG